MPVCYFQPQTFPFDGQVPDGDKKIIKEINEDINNISFMKVFIRLWFLTS